MKQHSHEFWNAKAVSLALRNRAFINGEFVDPVGGETYEVVNPATEKTLAIVAACSARDVDTAVSFSRQVFENGDWSREDPEHRKAVLLRLAELILEHQDELALLESLDMGKPVMDALNVDIKGAASILRWYGELADKLYGEVAPTGTSSVATITREPVGVVAAVVPWNFPLDLAIWKLGPALVTGNSVLLKPAEQSPHSALRLAELAIEAGLPTGVLNVLPGLGEITGKALGLHDDIDVLTFTGSTEVGKLYLQYSGQSNMKAVWLETGGKSPNLVFADCENLDQAADNAVKGIFFNQGEVCSANSRLLVDSSIHDIFVEKIVERASKIKVGDPLDPSTSMGPLVSRDQLSRVMTLIGTAQEENCSLRLGGSQVAFKESELFVPPTIFTQVKNDMTVAREEVFGPVLTVISFDSEDEAIAIANDTPYGLAASVWTDNLKRAHRVASKLRAGTVSVNTVDALSPMTPFGGYKQSGIGRDLSVHAVDKFTELKTTWIELSE